MFGAGLPELLLLVLLVAVVLGAVALFVRSLGRERVRVAEAEVRRLRGVLDDVRELAWAQRELDPDLSSVIVDTIRAAERDDQVRRSELPG